MLPMVTVASTNAQSRAVPKLPKTTRTAAHHRPDPDRSAASRARHGEGRDGMSRKAMNRPEAIPHCRKADDSERGRQQVAPPSGVPPTNSCRDGRVGRKS